MEGEEEEAKEVRWRQPHCVLPDGSGTQPQPVKACFELFQAQLRELLASMSAHPEPE